LQTGRKKDFFPGKIIAANIDDPMSGYFLSFAAAKKIGVSFQHVLAPSANKVFFANMLKSGPPLEFEIENQIFNISMLGDFNAKNAALAAACAYGLGFDLAKSAEALNSFGGVIGRMQGVANNLGIKIIVDYGCEPASIKSALQAAAQMPHDTLIHVFGSTGGHRDVSKRFEFGKFSAQFADVIIVTNDDVYNSDPQEIANNIEQGILSFKLRKPEYQIILDRRAAIAEALLLAKKNDIVLITGKGSEQFLVLPGNKRIEWDDVAVVKEELEKIEK
jgi:UDP-N-acetylmuramoyl-L-alanyl-D-glutamate--2,6-diaminopimelate ligase